MEEYKIEFKIKIFHCTRHLHWHSKINPDILQDYKEEKMIIQDS